ncbi:methyl-accepting chemotaxis protein [Desulfuromonas sp. TF]|uniref:methyl-accepting chemotaxis protein n=1 Tax=Desulfuromonas sp. TF TaxID=1232410 RepID=UPI0003F5BF2D|nr:methyl-accepting chemotaxis protein [Desulfuromonas sp. TF]
MGNIKSRLISGFLSVVAIFAIGAGIAGTSARQAAIEARLFLNEYWPTSALLLETNIVLDEIAVRAINPPSDSEPSEMIDSIRTDLEEIQRKFEASGLTRTDIDRINGRIGLFMESIALPIMLHSVPGKRMEEADAAADPLLEKMGIEQDAYLLSMTWETIMSFNDFLITGDPAEKESFLRLTDQIENHSAFDAFRSEYEPFKEMAEQVFDSALQLENAHKFFRLSLDPLTEDLQETGAQYRVSVVQPASEKIQASLRTILSTMMWATLISALLSIMIGFVLARGLGNPIRRVMEVLGKLEKGHLDTRAGLKRRDEIGQMSSALDRMSDKLSGMVLRIRRSADELIGISANLAESATSVETAAGRQSEQVEKASAAMMSIRKLGEQVGDGMERLTESAADSTSSVLEMSANIEEVAQNAENLALSVEEVNSAIQEMAAAFKQISENILTLRESSDSTASSVAQMDASIEQVEENARNIRLITEEVRTDAERGQQSVEATIGGIEEIRRASKAAGEVVLSLADKAVGIGRILSVIEDVTDQTSLLALNAAIIAAQAGDRGRSFAVVADEIRELADRTSLSTREIAEVIQAVQDDTRRAVETIQKADIRITEGENLSRQSGKALNKIVSGVAGAVRQMDQIAMATQEQAQGSRIIRSAMEKMATMVDQTATAMVEQEKGSQAIRSAAEKMWEMTTHVKNSTREQSNAAKTIARSTENIDEQVQMIMAACEQQGRQGEEVDHAVAQIRDSAKDNLEFVQLLNQIVRGMSGQVKILQREMTMFKGLKED